MLRTASIAEQVANYLREEVGKGRWTGLMPGRNRLAEELGVNGRTVERALEQLEREGLLKSQGRGKRRRIVGGIRKSNAIQVEIILYEAADRTNDFILELKNHLHAAGHALTFAPKSMVQLRTDPKQIEKMVQAHPARAWLLSAGSREILQWFAQAPVPAFALFGVARQVDIAAAMVDKVSAMREAVRRLAQQGQTRIVMLTREERRKPRYGLFLKSFLEELQNQGIPAGAYNVPDWEETREGFHKCLDALFEFTPPAAIIIDDAVLVPGLQNYLIRQTSPAARNVTLLPTDYHPTFDWYSPSIAYIGWDRRPVLNRVVRWVNNLARGKDDREKFIMQAKLIPGDVPALQG